jgi:O-antigen ligase
VGSFSRKALASLAIVGFALLLFTPLSKVVEDRASHSHSNEGRAYLYEETWKAMKNSPLVGYGGPLPSDKSRILPAIGTQGQLWNVMISQGAVGTVLFVGFLLRMTWATRRGPLVTFWAHVVLVVALVQLPIYDMMPTPLHIVFVVAALGLRELHEPDREVPPRAIETSGTPAVVPAR